MVWTPYYSPWIMEFRWVCLILWMCYGVATLLQAQPQKESDDKSHAEGKAKHEDKHADDFDIAFKEGEKKDRIKGDGYKAEDIPSLFDALIVLMTCAVGAYVLSMLKILYSSLFSDVFLNVVVYLVRLVAGLMVALCMVFQIRDLMDRGGKRKRVKMNHGNDGVKQTGQEGMMARMEEAHFKWLSKMSVTCFMVLSVGVVTSQVAHRVAFHKAFPASQMAFPASQMAFPWPYVLAMGVVTRITSVTRRKKFEMKLRNRGNNKETKKGPMRNQWDGFSSSEMMRIWDDIWDDIWDQSDSEEETDLISTASGSSGSMWNGTSEDGSWMDEEDEGWGEDDSSWEEAREE